MKSPSFKLTNLLCFFFVFWNVLGVTGEDKEIPNELKKIIDEFQAQNLKYIHELKPYIDKNTAIYNSFSPPVNVSQQEINEALSFIQDKSYYDGSSIETDIFFIPNYLYSKFELNWETASDGNQNFKVENTFNNKSGFLDENGFLTMHIRTPDKKQLPKSISAVNGTMQVDIPIEFKKISFSPEELNKVKNNEGYSAKLIKCNHDLAVLEIKSIDNEKEILIIYDSTGKRVVVYRDVGVRNSKTHENLISCRAEGIIDRIDIYFPVKKIQKVLNLSANNSNTMVGNKTKVLKPRYALLLGKYNFKKLTEVEVKRDIKVFAGRCNALSKYNFPEVRVMLPKFDNSAYAEINIETPVVTDTKGTRIPVQTLGSGYYMHNSFTKELMIYRKGSESILDIDEQSAPINFAKMSGNIKVKYPLEIVTESYKIEGKLPETLLVSAPNTLEYNPEILSIPDFFNTNFRNGFCSVRAFDNENRLLKPFSGQGSKNSSEIDPKTKKRVELSFFIIKSFWGTIYRFEIDRVKKWAEFGISYELEPAKMLPPLDE